MFLTEAWQSLRIRPVPADTEISGRINQKWRIDEVMSRDYIYYHDRTPSIM